MISEIEETQPDIVAESAETIQEVDVLLSDRHKQILALMSEETEYSAEEIAELLGLKGSRTRQLKSKKSFSADDVRVFANNIRIAPGISLM